MNLYIHTIATDEHLEFVRVLINKYDNPNLYIVLGKRGASIKVSKSLKASLKELRSKIPGNVQEAYYVPEIHKADYKSYRFFKECPPLDEDILMKMAVNEPIILKMLERHDIYVKNSDFEIRVHMYHRHLRYWNYMLDAAQIDAVVFSTAPHEVFDYIIYCLCKIKNIAVSLIQETSFLSYSYFSNTIFETFEPVKKHYDLLSERYKNASIEEIPLSPQLEKLYLKYSSRDSDKTPWYMRKSYSPVARIKSVAGNTMKYGLGHLKKVVNNHVKALPLFLHGAENMFKIKRVYNKLTRPADFSAKYIYLPLHFQPENTTCPKGRYFVYQLLVAQMLSFYLPKDVKLYVKEHPMPSRGGRTAQLYYDLATLDNIVLIKTEVDTFKLIENCIAVASVTGTAGFEGLFLGKPFLMFGYMINSAAPGTFSIRSNEDCREALDYILKNGAKHTLKDMKVFMKALEETTTFCAWDPNGINTMEISMKENMARIANEMHRVLSAQMS